MHAGLRTKRKIVSSWINQVLGGGFTIPRAGLAAQFDAKTGITSAGGFASAWADLSGNARPLLQATGANQPIHLPFSGVKYGWLPGVAGNYFSTPDSVANSITGTIDVDFCGAAVDWTPAATATLVTKDLASGAAGSRAYAFFLGTSGQLIYQFSTDGITVAGTATSSASDGGAALSCGGVDGFTLHVRCKHNTTTGKVSFYTSANGATWVQLGVDQTVAAGAIFNNAHNVNIGASGATGTGLFFPGNVYSAHIYSGDRAAGGTLAVDFDPSRWSSGTTFTASTGELWTINSTGSKPAQIVDRPSLLFDGAAHFMKCAAFTLNQPTSIYWVGKQVTWVSGRVVFDGNVDNSMLLFQTVGTPSVTMFAGSAGPAQTGLAVGATGVLSCVFNGASSSSTLNQSAAVAGNVGANNAGGFTLARAGSTNAAFGNIQAYEALIYNVAHDAATRANIIRALMSKHGVA